MRCMLRVGAASLAMMTVGCESTNQSAQYNSPIDKARSVCQQYGYSSGTVQFADCVRQTVRCQTTSAQRLEDLTRAIGITQGRRMVRERVLALGRDSIYNLTGLVRAFPLDSEDLPSLDNQFTFYTHFLGRAEEPALLSVAA